MGVEPPNFPSGYVSGHCCKPQPSVIIIIIIIIVIGHYLSIYLSRKHKTHGNHIQRTGEWDHNDTEHCMAYYKKNADALSLNYCAR